MKILMIAPFPPPLTGHSIADKLLLESLEVRHEVSIVDLSSGSKHDGTVNLKRLRAVINVLINVLTLRKGVDVAYLTISESIAGNIKDLLILWFLRREVRKIVLHLHGGSFRVAVLERSWLLRKLNKIFLRQVDRVIITGKSHEGIFHGFVNPNRLSIVPNFALMPLFSTKESIQRKFDNPECIRVLYVSGMDQRKGYTRLLNAYLVLPAEVRGRFRLDFAGRFDDPIEQAQFEERIQSYTDITYHGVVDGDRKSDLFHSAHVVCLPTAYLEGQPLTILEAYASGCIVLTTPQPGILDIFSPGVNGQLISAKDTVLLKEILGTLAADPARFLDTALGNYNAAVLNYRSDIFCERMICIIED